MDFQVYERYLQLVVQQQLTGTVEALQFDNFFYTFCVATDF